VTYERAGELARGLGTCSDIAPITYGRWAHVFVRGDLSSAYALGQEFVAVLAEDDPLRLVGHRMLGYPKLALGEPAAARDHAERTRER